MGFTPDPHLAAQDEFLRLVHEQHQAVYNDLKLLADTLPPGSPEQEFFSTLQGMLEKDLKDQTALLTGASHTASVKLPQRGAQKARC